MLGSIWLGEISLIELLKAEKVTFLNLRALVLDRMFRITKGVEARTVLNKFGTALHPFWNLIHSARPIIYS